MNEMFWVIMIVTCMDTMGQKTSPSPTEENVKGIIISLQKYFIMAKLIFHLFLKFVQRFVCNECNIMGLSIVIFGKLQQKYVYNYCLTNILMNNEVKLHNPKCIMHCFKNVRENSRFCNS